MPPQKPKKYFDIARPGSIPVNPTAKPFTKPKRVSLVDPMIAVKTTQLPTLDHHQKPVVPVHAPVAPTPRPVAPISVPPKVVPPPSPAVTPPPAPDPPPKPEVPQPPIELELEAGSVEEVLPAQTPSSEPKTVFATAASPVPPAPVAPVSPPAPAQAAPDTSTPTSPPSQPHPTAEIAAVAAELEAPAAVKRTPDPVKVKSRKPVNAIAGHKFRARHPRLRMLILLLIGVVLIFLLFDALLVDGIIT